MLPHDLVSTGRLLENKVAFTTGTNRGIGRAMIESFARHGAVVYANARRDGCLDDVASELAAAYQTEVLPIYCDVTDRDAMRAAFIRISKTHGSLGVLVSNAGVMRDALIGMVSDEVMQAVFAVNVHAVVHTVQYAARLMTRQRRGSIINMSSIVGFRGNAWQLAYSASKGAVIALTRTAAKELAPLGIRVNAIAPGLIDTDMLRSVGAERLEKYLPSIGSGRLGRPEDIAETAAFLASDLSEYMTGQVLGVDGGMVL
jgi:3-oxoacyl-[acyl-carrier protein] reductase